MNSIGKINTYKLYGELWN